VACSGGVEYQGTSLNVWDETSIMVGRFFVHSLLFNGGLLIADTVDIEEAVTSLATLLRSLAISIFCRPSSWL
jgi:hypothetical protein